MQDAPLIVVLNAGSGHDDVEEAEAEIRAALDAGRRDYEVITPKPQAIASTIDHSPACAA